MLRNRTAQRTLAIEAISMVPDEGEVLIGSGKRYRILRSERMKIDSTDVVIIHTEEADDGDYLHPNRTVRLQR